MKTQIALYAALASLFLLGSCKKDSGIYKNFEIEYVYEVEVPANTLLEIPREFFAAEEESNAEAQFELNDTRKDLVDEMYLTNLYLEITRPNNEDFSFLESISFFVDADDLPETKVAEKNPVPTGTYQELQLDVLDTDLASYIKRDQFGVRINVVTDEQRSNDITIKGYATFNVRAKILDL